MKQLLCALVVFSILSCDLNDQNVQCPQDEYNYVFSIGSLDIDTMDSPYYTILGGPFPVFRYIHKSGLCDDIIGNESMEQVVFEIQTESLILELKDEALTNIKCHYIFSTNWNYHFKAIDSGDLRAHNINADEWEISVNLNVELNSGEVRNISFEETFQKQ